MYVSRNDDYTSDNGDDFNVGGGRGRFATLFLQQVAAAAAAANANAATDRLPSPGFLWLGMSVVRFYFY